MNAPSHLTPNREAMTRHLDWLVAPARDQFPEALFEIAWDSRRDGQVNAARLFRLDEIDAAVSLAATKNASGHNLYVGLTLKKPTTAREGRTSADDFLAMTVLAVDADAGGARSSRDRRAGIDDHDGDEARASATTLVAPR